MKSDYPQPKDYPQLVSLWQEAFGDTQEFIEGFFHTAFSPARCRCILDQGRVVAALYWLDGRLGEYRYAYLYAVAVAKSHRGRGLCPRLMADVHNQLKLRGYAGALLVPQDQGLRQMYGNMGYRDCTCVEEFSAEAGEPPLALERIDRDTYARLRRACLPAGALLQEEENIAYQETMTFFYRGDKILLAANRKNKSLWVPELLGDREAAPGILAALECTQGHFRTPGSTFPFAMFLPLMPEAPVPSYLGLSFD